MKRITIAKDFSDTPVGRFPEDGQWNGTRFREEFLRPALSQEDFVEVSLDGVEGYGSSFLEEAFGGLIRLGYFKAEDLTKRLKIIFSDPDNEPYDRVIWKHIREASLKK